MYRQLGAEKYGFWRASADITQYIHLFYHRTLVLRVAGEMVQPFSDKDIPFYHLSQLGERETIRGFKRGRFHDRDMLLGSAEYRYPLSRNDREHSGIEAIIFADAGQVSPDITNDFSFDEFRPGYGAGIRFYGEDGMTTKIEFGKSRDGFRFYFVLN